MARFTTDGRLVYGTVEGPLHVVDPDAAAFDAALARRSGDFAAMHDAKVAARRSSPAQRAAV